MNYVFSAQCDKFVRDRRIFELALIETAKAEIKDGNVERAKEILGTDFSDEYKRLRAELFDFADFGLQKINQLFEIKTGLCF